MARLVVRDGDVRLRQQVVAGQVSGAEQPGHGQHQEQAGQAAGRSRRLRFRTAGGGGQRRLVVGRGVGDLRPDCGGRRAALARARVGDHILLPVGPHRALRAGRPGALPAGRIVGGIEQGGWRDLTKCASTLGIGLEQRIERGGALVALAGAAGGRQHRGQAGVQAIDAVEDAAQRILDGAQHAVGHLLGLPALGELIAHQLLERIEALRVDAGRGDGQALHHPVRGPVGGRLDERFDGLIAEAGRLGLAAKLVETLGQLAQAVVDGVDALELPARLLQIGVEAADLGLDLLEVVAIQAPGDVLEGNRQAPLQLLHADTKRAHRLVGVDAGDGALQALGDVGQPALEPGTTHAAAHTAAGAGRSRCPAAIVRWPAGRAALAPLRLALLVGPRQRFRRLLVPGPARRPTAGRRGADVWIWKTTSRSLWARVCGNANALTSGVPQGVIEAARRRLRSGRQRRAQCCLGRGHQLESSWPKVAIRRKVSVKCKQAAQWAHFRFAGRSRMAAETAH